MAQESSKFALASVLSVVLSVLFLFPAAVPLRYLRLFFGRTAFWVSSCLGTAILVYFNQLQWALSYSSLCVLIGGYRELEELQVPVFTASVVTILGTAGANLVALYTYSVLAGQNLKTLFFSKLVPLLEKLQDVEGFKGLEPGQAIWFLPTLMVIMLMLVLCVSLSLNDTPETQIKNSLSQFRVADWMIWPFLLGLSITVLDFGSERIGLIGTNILFISMAIYFFQGLGVINHYLIRMRAGSFWRMLVYILAFVQLFAFVSVLGILDFWMDFRAKPKAAQNQLNSH